MISAVVFLLSHTMATGENPRVLLYCLPSLFSYIIPLVSCIPCPLSWLFFLIIVKYILKRLLKNGSRMTDILISVQHVLKLFLFYLQT